MALKEVIRDADSMNVLLQARLSAAFSDERQIISVCFIPNLHFKTKLKYRFE